MKGSRPGVKRCQQSTEEDTIPKKKDRSQYEKNLHPARNFNEEWKEGREWLEMASELDFFSVLVPQSLFYGWLSFSIVGQLFHVLLMMLKSVGQN